MALAVVSSGQIPDVRTALNDLQFAQFQHDETYHREITRLPTQQRLRHMAFHFAKYSGNFVAARAAGDEAEIQRIATDVFIIGMSTANALNCKLAGELPSQHEATADSSSFAAALAVGAGRMAAACEKLDHLEDFPFRGTIRSAAVDLVRSAITFAEAKGWDLQNLVRLRLKPVKEKFIYHGSV